MVIEKTPNGERSYDIYSRLLEDRIIMVSGEVNDAMSTSVISQLLFLQQKDPSKDIHMYIQSGGGSVLAGLAMIDTMNLIKPHVNTYCNGLCASMGAMLLMCGEKGKRHCLENGYVMIHQVSSGTSGTFKDQKTSLAFTEVLQDSLMGMIAAKSGQKVAKVTKDCDRDYYMSATEAKKYGVIDKVIK